MSAPFVIGVISDTHGLLRPQALAALQGSQHIIHAGDIGGPSIIPALRQIAPVTAIRGNVDVEPWAREFPATAAVQLAGSLLYVLHDGKQLDLAPKAAGIAAIISGHSHTPLVEQRNGVLYFNPGSAGPRRFKLPVTLGRLTVAEGRVEAEVIPLAV